MNKAEYLNIIEKNVRDIGRNFVKFATISAVSYSNPLTTFTVDDIAGFYAGDNIYMKDSLTTFFGEVTSINETENKIIIAGNLSAIALGTQIKKNDAEQYLNNALLTYSKFRPLELIEAYNLTGEEENNLPLAWDPGFSSIIKLMHLIRSSVVDEKYYYVDLSTENIYKLFISVALTGAAWLQFTVKHGFNSSYNSTVPETDVYAVCDIASAYYMLALASRFAQSTNQNSLGADVVNYEQKPNQYIILYNNYLNKAAMWLNIDVEDLKKGRAVEEAESCNQEMDSTIYDDEVLIRSNYIY